jgi:GNAT superfamily N-acetyltransferase
MNVHPRCENQPMVEIREEPADGEAGARLLGEFVARLEDLYGDFDPARTPSATAGEMAPPGGAFLVVYDDGAPIACGGVKQLEPGVGELKRMYVAPRARRRGHARRLLSALEEAARRRGHRRLRLDTGPLQPEAHALYTSAGYREIPDYNGNAYASYWFEKDLTAP